LAEAPPPGSGYPLRLALPVAETALLCGAYAEARVILEYGAGGSTLIAGQVPGAKVFAVDSDPAWIARLSSRFAANPPEASVVLHHADIGPVRDWGHPADRSGRARWPGYASDIWERPDFTAPDVVFIDGRFRLACFLTVLLRSQGMVTVLWDDYAERPAYHAAERFVLPVEVVGRMARFEIGPQVPREGAADLLAECRYSPA
jgi:hypothetical protein